MPANTSGGRRAAQASAEPMENDQAERDASLRKVEARDLVEFGMIPVSESKGTSPIISVHEYKFRFPLLSLNLNRNLSVASQYWFHSTV